MAEQEFQFSKKMYDGITKAKIRALAKKVHANGGSSAHLAMLCEESGIKSPSGGKLEVKHVTYYMDELKKMTTTPNGRCPKTVASLLTDATLDDSQKVRMLSAYYELS